MTPVVVVVETEGRTVALSGYVDPLIFTPEVMKVLAVAVFRMEPK